MAIERIDGREINGDGCLVKAGESIAAFIGGFGVDGIINGWVEPRLFGNAEKLMLENSPQALEAAAKWARSCLPDISSSSHEPNLILGSGLLILYAASKLVKEDRPGKHFTKIELALRGFWGLAAGASIFLSPQIIQKAVETPNQVTDWQWAMLGIAAFEVGKGILNFVKFRQRSHISSNAVNEKTPAKKKTHTWGYRGDRDEINTRPEGELDPVKRAEGVIKSINDRISKAEIGYRENPKISPEQAHLRAVQEVEKDFKSTGFQQFGSTYNSRANNALGEVYDHINGLGDEALDASLAASVPAAVSKIASLIDPDDPTNYNVQKPGDDIRNSQYPWGEILNLPELDKK